MFWALNSRWEVVLDNDCAIACRRADIDIDIDIDIDTDIDI